MLQDVKRCYTMLPDVSQKKITSLLNGQILWIFALCSSDPSPVSCEQVNHELVQQYALFLLAEKHALSKTMRGLVGIRGVYCAHQSTNINQHQSTKHCSTWRSVYDPNDHDGITMASQRDEVSSKWPHLPPLTWWNPFDRPIEMQMFQRCCFARNRSWHPSCPSS